MRPLNISGQNAKDYYYQKDPFFSVDDQQNSAWVGKGSKQLGLNGIVKQEDFLNVISGNSPQGKKLIQNGVGKEHRSAIDVPFSAPKSVSILGLHCGHSELINAHDEAIKSTIKILEREYVGARKTENKKTRFVQTGKIVAATFQHSTSRENDPQLHTHCLIMNMTNLEKKWRATCNDKIFSHQKLITSIYQSELAMKVKKLGYEIQMNKNGTWDIAGINKKVLDIFSKRRKDILEKKEKLQNKDKGFLEKVSVLGTRKDKNTGIEKEELLEQWEKEFSRKKIEKMIRQQLKNQEYKKQAKESCQKYIKQAYDIINESESTFTMPKVLDRALQLSRGVHQYKDMKDAFKKAVGNDIVKLYEKKGRYVKEKVYTSTKMLGIERSILKNYKAGINRMLPMIDYQDIQESLQNEYSYFTEGQKHAVIRTLCGKDQFQLIQGDAGSGKTTAMAAVNKLLTGHTDKTIIGAGFTGKSAFELQEKSGFECMTINSFLNKTKIDADIWIIDESSMVGSKQMKQIIDRSIDKNAKVVFIGDGKQLQAISAGRMFKDLQTDKTVFMEQVMRQETPHMKGIVDLIKDYQDGKDKGGIEKTFDYLELEEAIIEHKDDDSITNAVINEYIQNPDKTLILTSENQARINLNTKIVDKLQEKGVVSKDSYNKTIRTPVSISDTSKFFASSYERGQRIFLNKKIDKIKPGTDMKIIKTNNVDNTITVRYNMICHKKFNLAEHANDFSVYKEDSRNFARCSKIVFLKNDKKIGLQNGSTGEIKNIAGNIMTVKMDNGQSKKINTDNYQYFDHGYAVTVHKSQGMTQENVIMVVHSGNKYMNSTEQFYVGVSRAKKNIKLFTDNKEAIIEQFKKPQEKTSTLERQIERRSL